MCIKRHRTLIKFLLLELHTLDFLRNSAFYTWHSRIRVSATSHTVFKIMLSTLQQSMNIAWVTEGYRRLQNADQSFY